MACVLDARSSSIAALKSAFDVACTTAVPGLAAASVTFTFARLARSPRPMATSTTEGGSAPSATARTAPRVSMSFSAARRSASL